MSSKSKRIILTGITTLMLAGFSADIILNSNPITVQAAKHHKKKAKKKKVKHTNQGTSGNDKNTQTASDNTNPESATAGTTPQSNYQTLGDWYIANDQYLYNSYSGKGLFQDGVSDAEDGNQITPSKYNNDYYKEGWIISYVNGYNNKPTDNALYGGTADNYNKALEIYNAGVAYIQSKKSTSPVNYDLNSNSWF